MNLLDGLTILSEDETCIYLSFEDMCIYELRTQPFAKDYKQKRDNKTVKIQWQT